MTDFNFCLVMKDNTNLDAIPEQHRDRVRIFNRVNAETVRLLINSCVCAICTCDVPMVARPMGCYIDRMDDKSWGLVCEDEEFPEKLRYVASNLDQFSPREYYSKEYTLERCMEKWSEMLEEFVS